MLHSDPTLSVFILIACRMDLYRLGLQDTVSIEFLITFLHYLSRHGNP